MLAYLIDALTPPSAGIDEYFAHLAANIAGVLSANSLRLQRICILHSISYTEVSQLDVATHYVVRSAMFALCVRHTSPPEVLKSCARYQVMEHVFDVPNELDRQNSEHWLSAHDVELR